MRHFVITSALVFTLVCAGWLTRIILGFPIVVNGYSVPVTWSVVPMLVTGAMAVWAFRVARDAKA
jgi:hypothetical protein